MIGSLVLGKYDVFYRERVFYYFHIKHSTWILDTRYHKTLYFRRNYAPFPSHYCCCWMSTSIVLLGHAMITWDFLFEIGCASKPLGSYIYIYVCSYWVYCWWCIRWAQPGVWYWIKRSFIGFRMQQVGAPSTEPAGFLNRKRSQKYKPKSLNQK